MKRPAFQFYPSDWRNDAGLRLCSIAARGLWADMMCLMHDGTPYGHLTVLGRALTPDALARLVGESATLVRKLLTELRENEVFSETPEGIVFSRRMVRDEDIRNRRGEGGSAGAEHGHKGASHGVKGGRPRKEKPPLSDDERGVSKPSPSSSPSSPSSEQVSDADASGAEAPPMPPADPVKVMFDQGIRLLGEAGKSEASARSLLGRWRQAHGEEAVITALGKAQREGAIDPVSFIEGCFRSGGRNGQRNHHNGQSGGHHPLGRTGAASDRAFGVDS